MRSFEDAKRGRWWAEWLYVDLRKHINRYNLRLRLHLPPLLTQSPYVDEYGRRNEFPSVRSIGHESGLPACLLLCKQRVRHIGNNKQRANSRNRLRVLLWCRETICNYKANEYSLKGKTGVGGHAGQDGTRCEMSCLIIN